MRIYDVRFFQIGPGILKQVSEAYRKVCCAWHLPQMCRT
jgi:hypothetical protein